VVIRSLEFHTVARSSLRAPSEATFSFTRDIQHNKLKKKKGRGRIGGPENALTELFLFDPYDLTESARSCKSNVAS